MEIATLATAAVTWLIANIKNSKGAEKASSEVSTAIWDWVRPIFLKDDEPLKDLEVSPDNTDNQQEVTLKVKKYLEKNPNEVASLTALLKNEGVDKTYRINQQHFGTGDNIGRDKITYN